MKQTCCCTSLLYALQTRVLPSNETRSDLRGAKGIRTPDLLHAMQTRYQLRHSPAAPPTGWNADSIPVLGACVVLDQGTTKTRGGHGPRRGPPALRRYPDPRDHPGPQTPTTRTYHPHRQAARPLLGLRFRGTPGAHNAITDVPSIEVGSQTLIQNDNVRIGVTAIHPCGKANPGYPVAAGCPLPERQRRNDRRLLDRGVRHLSGPANEDMTGLRGHRSPALPEERLAEIAANR